MQAIQVIKGTVWFVVAICAVVAIFEGRAGWSAAESSPQQAAAMSQAIAIATIPYVLGRAVEKFVGIWTPSDD